MQKKSTNFLKLVLTLWGRDDIVYFAAGDKSQRTAGRTLTNEQQCNPENSEELFRNERDRKNCPDKEEQ